MCSFLCFSRLKPKCIGLIFLLAFLSNMIKKMFPNSSCLHTKLTKYFVAILQYTAHSLFFFFKPNYCPLLFLVPFCLSGGVKICNTMSFFFKLNKPNFLFVCVCVWSFYTIIYFISFITNYLRI